MSRTPLLSDSLPSNARRAVATALIALATVVLGASSALAQNTVRLAPAFQGADAGAVVTLDLEIDFSDPSLGGGLVVEFDSAHLAYQSFSWDGAFPDDPGLRLVCPSAHPACGSFPSPGVLVAFAVDSFSYPAISGPHTVGTVSFDVLASTRSELSVREDDSVAGPLVGEGAFAAPSFSGAIVIRDVELPALGGVGLLALAGALVLSRAWVAPGR